MRDLASALDQFRPHSVTDVTGPKHAASRAVFERAVTDLWAIVPDGPEKTLVMRKLQEASMLSNVAIALSGHAVALPDATQAPAVTEALAQSGVVRVTVDGHGFITTPGEWGVLELRKEMGIMPDRSLWVASRDGIGRTHLHRNETVVVQAGHAFFTTPEQPPAAARYLPADDAS